MTFKLSRRGFLVGCSSAIAAMAGARLTHLAFGDATANAAAGDDVLVVMFLRGGWDALNVVMPIDGPDRSIYESNRQNLRVPTTGTNKAIPIGGQFGMHPAMAPLYGLYQSQRLAFVHAVGLPYDTRSHFDAQAMIELGTPGSKTTASGWLTRHLQSAASLGSNVLIPALSAGNQQAMSLLSYDDAAAFGKPKDFRVYGDWKYGDPQQAALRVLYSGDTWLDIAGRETLDKLDALDAAAPGDYVPSGGAAYPNGSLGDSLKAVAQLIKMQIDLKVATVDFGGWDTHESQGDGSGGYFANQLGQLAQGLAAFYTDLDACGNGYAQRTTIAVISEFGRRLQENSNNGTDHGHGSLMLVLGGAVNGGKVYGQWPGLAKDQLYDKADLAVTTDYRRVLSDILINRCGNDRIDVVFPGYTGYTPMGIVRAGQSVTPPPFPSGANRVFLPIERAGVPDVCK